MTPQMFFFYYLFIQIFFDKLLMSINIRKHDISLTSKHKTHKEIFIKSCIFLFINHFGILYTIEGFQNLYIVLTLL